ncbi:hypothetical protein CC2G_014613 [Coprinopsis cinerea AmutBmut pab1-1]|nr:hypothetical protein CC2G_014613 [Coprinopsis cinerea AmutBmut pab1-1]
MVLDIAPNHPSKICFTTRAIDSTEEGDYKRQFFDICMERLEDAVAMGLHKGVKMVKGVVSHGEGAQRGLPRGGPFGPSD